MLRFVILLALISIGTSLHAKTVRFTTGMGLETRVDREINPGFSEVRPVGQVFQQIHFHPWTLALEFGYQKKDSSAGALRIQAVTGLASAWGRYAFSDSETWAPFVGGGLGASFDRVTSSYGAASDRRRGIRYLGGVGGGITNVYWDYLMLEAEARVSLEEDRKDPMFALVVRAGVQL